MRESNKIGAMTSDLFKLATTGRAFGNASHVIFLLCLTDSFQLAACQKALQKMDPETYGRPRKSIRSGFVGMVEL